MKLHNRFKISQNFQDGRAFWSIYNMAVTIKSSDQGQPTDDVTIVEFSGFVADAMNNTVGRWIFTSSAHRICPIRAL